MELMFLLGGVTLGVAGVWLISRRRQPHPIEPAPLSIPPEVERVRQQFEGITQNTTEGIILLDAAQCVIFLNAAAQELFHTRNGIGHGLDEIAWSWDLQPLLKDVAQLASAESFSQMVSKDERTLQVRACALPPESGAAALILLRETTEVERLGRIRRELVANVSHELRTPITTLNLLAETLENELPSDSTLARDWLTKLRGQIDLLNQLTNEMMDLSMIESGQMPIKLVDSSVVELVTEALTPLLPQVERKQITLDAQVPADLRVLADSDGIEKVLRNLFHNAIKFTLAQGHITVHARRVGDNVEIQVADNGIGIPARDLPRIFERFYKVDRARTPGASRGTGLGLAIAKHIIEGHGGQIWAESTEGNGSTFYLTLPAS